MAITKTVKIKIRSYMESLDEQGESAGEAEVVEESFEGELLCECDSVTVKYREATEGGPVSCAMIHSAAGLTVRRQGAISAVLEFGTGKVCRTVYEVAPYKFDVTVTTRAYRSSLSAFGGTVDILYYMDIGRELRRTRMKIEVTL